MESLDDGDNCPICMAPMGPYVALEDEIAVLPCQHCYHNSCILEWIQTATSCPYCRCDFASITIVQELKGPTVRTYTVEPKVQEEQLSDIEDEAYVQSEESIGAGGRRNTSGCQICGSYEREDILMLCEFCDGCYHSFCLGAEELPQEAFCCPVCATNGERLSNLPETPILRTVASRRASRRTRRTRAGRRPVDRQVQYDTWRAAWERVALRAWSRLNAELDYQLEVEPSLTRQQEEELRHWRTRVERRSTPISTTNETLDLGEQVSMDPQTANLWAAFEQARNFSRSPRSQDAKTVEPDEVVANGSAVPAEPSAPTTKQKRPNASRKRKGSEEIEVPRKETRVRSNSIVVKQDTSQTGFLSSLLKNIKDSSTDQGPALSSPRHTIPSSIHRQRQYSPPLSPSNAGSSAGSDHTQSRPQSPTDPECESRPSSPVVRYNKTDLSRLVSSQLKPLYHVKLTKDEFTTINRTVTRRLFDDPLVCVESEAGLRTRIAREIRHELDEILIPID